MATPQLSPGVLVREVDLTVGRAENVLDNIGAIAGPFSIGPVDEAIDIQTQQQFINTFGKPISTDSQYEYWMAASSFLSYGGVLKVVRTGGSTLKNGNAGVNAANESQLVIDNYDDYQSNHTTDTGWVFAAKNPGTWSNTLKVCVIDNASDQTISIATSTGVGATVGGGISTPLESVVVVGNGSTSEFSGYLDGIITGISTSGNTSTIDVKIISRYSTDTETSYPITYTENDTGKSFKANDTLTFVDNSGTSSTITATAITVVDWYDAQTLGLTNSTVYWKGIAQRPVSSNYSDSRSGSNDSLHVVVIDDTGDVTGIQGNILEKHTFLSKASDSIADGDSPRKIYYKDSLALNSNYIYAGKNPSHEEDTHWNTTPSSSGFQYNVGIGTTNPTGVSTSWNPITTGEGLWGQEAQGVTFSGIGNVTYELTGGVDYSASGGMAASLASLVTSYGLFSNKDEIDIDYLIMGPGLVKESESQAKANYLISLAEGRKDCMATISPHRENVVGVTNSTTQTTNILKFFSPISSSSYAVFDSGYKYTYDRFNNEFRYIPCNGDIAGMMVRTTIDAYPWYSPAGTSRGVLNNAIKLSYNPNKDQRDKLYSARVNSIVTQRGSGITLFGDKTALSYASSFDRINVRRLFLTVEQALEGAANAQLFELNDVNTRSNFVNIVEPYLRDVQAKRGIYDFLVVCDESNNTPDVVDNNEFRADIFMKPTKSINYITLSFVATRTGISFQEVVGTA